MQPSQGGVRRMRRQHRDAECRNSSNPSPSLVWVQRCMYATRSGLLAVDEPGASCHNPTSPGYSTESSTAPVVAGMLVSPRCEFPATIYATPALSCAGRSARLGSHCTRSRCPPTPKSENQVSNCLKRALSTGADVGNGWRRRVQQQATPGLLQPLVQPCQPVRNAPQC